MTAQVFADTTDAGLSGGWSVELQIGDPTIDVDTALWDVGQWDINKWGSSSPFGYLVDVTSRVKELSTKRGRRTFTRRFKTGVSQIVLSNNDGAFTPQSGTTTTGILPLRPGRSVRVRHRNADVFFGFIDTMDDIYLPDGSIELRIVAYDSFSSYQRNDLVAVAEVGGGDDLRTRTRRTRSHYLDDEQGIQLMGNPSGFTFQATTYAQDMLTELQIVAESEGGGCWMGTSGLIIVSQRDYFTDKAAGATDWTVGGVSPIKARDVVTERSAQRIITEAHMSRAGGTEQVAQNPEGLSLFGRRTHTRLDLVNSSDLDVAFLADRLVQFAGQDRLRVKELVFQPMPGSATELMCESAKFGDTMLVTVNTMASMGGWAWTAPTQLFGVSHIVTPDVWECHMVVDDSVFTQDLSAFSDGFDEGFS